MVVCGEKPNMLAALDRALEPCVGRCNAIKLRDLVRAVGAMTGWATGRRVRELIEAERPGVLFCTSRPGGYFLPSADPDVRRREIRDCMDSCQHYIRGMAARKAAIAKAYPEAVQLELWP